MSFKKNQNLRSKLILIALLAVNCTTLFEPQKIRPKLSELKNYQNCSVGEGSFRGRISYSDKSLSTDMDWRQNSQQLQIGVYHPLGQTLLGLVFNFEKKSAVLDGSMSGEDLVFGIDEDGFILVNGYFTGIMANELSCIFSFKWPMAWAHGHYQGDKRNSFVFEDQRRQVTIFSKNSKMKCAEISRNYFYFILNRKIEVCAGIGKFGRQISIQGPSQTQAILYEDNPQ